MSKFVLDCSMTMSWFFEDEADAYADRAMDRLNAGGAIVPQIWNYEIVNALIVGEKNKRLERTQSQGILKRLRKLPIVIDKLQPNETMAEILLLSGKYKLSAYDAAYLELAVRLALPVATRDNVLAKSVIASGLQLLK